MTEVVTRSDWSRNTWLTTKCDGHSTIVPVLVKTTGIGIIVWNTPEFPRVEFEIPEFPDLHFHLPCIKILGIHISDCKSSPVFDESNDTEPNSKPTRSMSRTSSFTSSITSSSSSACSQTLTASDCRLYCSTTTDANNTSVMTSCYSTSCYSTISRCHATGVTTTTIVSSTTSQQTCVITPQWPTTVGEEIMAVTLTGPACTATCVDTPSSVIAVAMVSSQASSALSNSILLAKRKSKKPVSDLSPPGHKCSLTEAPATPVRFPDYPGGVKVYQEDIDNKLLGTLAEVPRWYWRSDNGCGPPTITHAAVEKYAAFYTLANEDPDPSMDHACEYYYGISIRLISSAC